MSRLDRFDIRDHYRSGSDDLVKDFYMPCLSVAVRYDRAVGYFSSGSLRLALSGISSLVKNSGKLRLVISPALTAADLQAIEDGYTAREAINAAVERTARALLEELPTAQLELLRWLIAREVLDIRVATVAGPRPAIYHEKFGIFVDADALSVVFVGSSNETVSGLLANFESIEVFRSWNSGELARVRRRQQNFSDLWDGKEKSLEITAFPEAARRVILESGDAKPNLEAFELFDLQIESQPNETPALRSYQRDAARAWITANGRGILAMATGTGKTITALSIVSVIAKDYERRAAPLSIIVVVPYKHLVTQWQDTALRFGFRPILCYEAQQLWRERAHAELRAVEHGGIRSALLITTYSTFTSDAFQPLVRTATNNDAMLVADEVHNIGAAHTRSFLNERFRYRLGLSATPERFYDQDGTAALLGFFGGVVYELGLADAINRGILVPYRYYVHRIFLTENESQSYIDLTDRISRLGARADGEDPGEAVSEQVRRLLILRARVIATAQNKLSALLEVVKNDRPSRHTLVYCGDGRSGSDDERMVQSVVRELVDMHKTAESYTATTPMDTRDWLRMAFANGDVEYLVAIRCLDEGIDIPETTRAYFMASSTNPRQFIQRRGRVLRRSDATGKAHADIHDFLSLLNPKVQTNGAYAESVILRELARIRGFAQLAENGPQVLTQLLDLPITPHLLIA